MNSCIKLLFVVVSLVMVIQMINAATGIELVEASPDDPNMCFRSRDNLKLAIGESKAVEGCMKATCSKQDDKMMLHLTGCGFMVENERCKKTEDLTKPHPDCCPKLKCT